MIIPQSIVEWSAGPYLISTKNRNPLRRLHHQFHKLYFCEPCRRFPTRVTYSHKRRPFSLRKKRELWALWQFKTLSTLWHFLTTFRNLLCCRWNSDIDQILRIHSVSAADYGSHWGIYKTKADWSSDKEESTNCLHA